MKNKQRQAPIELAIYAAATLAVLIWLFTTALG